MIKLSKEQRLQVYKDVLDHFIADEFSTEDGGIRLGMCPVLLINTPGHRLKGEFYLGVRDEEHKEIQEMYPEFWSRKPEVLYHPYEDSDSEFWFPFNDFNSRISLLQECVDELQDCVKQQKPQ
jgi:hypothetical protein